MTLTFPSSPTTERCQVSTLQGQVRKNFSFSSTSKLLSFAPLFIFPRFLPDRCWNDFFKSLFYFQTFPTKHPVAIFWSVQINSIVWVPKDGGVVTFEFIALHIHIKLVGSRKLSYKVLKVKEILSYQALTCLICMCQAQKNLMIIFLAILSLTMQWMAPTLGNLCLMISGEDNHSRQLNKIIVVK